MLDEMMEEIAKLKEGNDLLEQVWLEYGPYGEGSIPDKLRYKINNFYGFDDSE